MNIRAIRDTHSYATPVYTPMDKPSTIPSGTVLTGVEAVQTRYKGLIRVLATWGACYLVLSDWRIVNGDSREGVQGPNAL